jgi:PAS domain S-box-containing protein
MMKTISAGMWHDGRRRVLPEKLREWLDMFAQMISIVPGPVYFKDISGRYRVFNRAFEKFMNMSGDELAGRSSRDVLPEEVADILEEMDGKLLCSGSLHQNFQTSYTDRFGRYLSVLVNKSILNLHGFHQGIVGVITDVTELVRTKEALEESRKLLRNIFEAIPDLLSVQDEELRVVQSNWHGGYGYVTEEHRSERPYCYDAYHPGQGKPCSPCHVLEVFRTGRPVLAEKWNPRVGHVEAHAFPIVDDAGKTVMVAEYVRNISKRKRTERDLCEANERLKAIIDASPLPIIAMDNQGIVKLWSHAAEKVFGWEAREVLDRVYPLLPEHRNKEFRSLFRRLNKGESMYGDTVLRERKDGSTLPVSRYSAPLRDASGRITGTMAVLEDITERKRAEDELKASESNYRAIFNAANDAIFVLDPETGAIIDVNSKLCEMYGFSREEALLLDIEAFSSGHPPYTQEFALAYVRKAGLGKSQLFEWMAKRKDGQVFWVEVSIKKTMLGGIPRALAAVRDISERRRAEESLRESEERFRQIFEQNEDAAMIINPETLAVVDVNSAMIRRYGHPQKRLFRQGAGLFLQQPELDKVRQALSEIHHTGKADISPLITFGKNDERIITSFKAKLIKAREVPYAYCSFRDITERLRIQEETKKMQTKLLQTNKMAALGTLSSGIAHEINNPVNFILSNAQMLHDAWKDIDLIIDEHARILGEPAIGGFAYGEAREIMPRLLSGIIEGSHRISTILAGLREFAREDKSPLEQKVSVNTVLEKAFTIIQNQLRNYTSHFHCSPAPEDLHVRGSLQQLEQMVINLTMNALQSLPDTNCGVYVSVSRDRQARNVVIKVRDQGVGMSPEVQKRIFDPFFTTRLDSGGTGLGLSICYSIIKEHQGTIEVESEPGRGTSVFVRIPLYRPGEVAHEQCGRR